MSQDLFIKIKNLEKDSSEKQKTLARYFLAHLNESSFQTVAEIAKEVGVSEPTVVRFAKALGYKGFPELRDEFQRIILRRLIPSERVAGAFGAGQDLGKIVDRVFERESRNLKDTHKALDIFNIERIVDCIVKAENKYVLGLRSSSGCAYILGRFLGHILPNVSTILSGHISVFEELRTIRKGDVLIAICYPRYVRTTVDALQFARDRGAATITITDSDLTPSAQVSQFSIVAVSNSLSFSNSYTACLSVINVLTSIISQKNKKQTKHYLEEWDILEPFNFFYKEKLVS